MLGSYCITLLGVIMAVNVHQSQAQCSMTEPCANQLGQGAAFEEATQLSDAGTAWSITMDVDIGTVNYDWLELKRRMYNGKINGPTWTVKPGDNVTVTLNNLLGPEGNDVGRPLNSDRFPNSTNLHTHGLHITAEDPQDNVLKEVDPGDSHTYEYQIHADQPPGTYWYHAHLHGSTAFQVAGGLSGMLIVQDTTGSATPAELAAVSCPNNCDKDIQLLFQPILIFRGDRAYGTAQDDILDNELFQHDMYAVSGGGTLTAWLETNVNYFTTNGQFQPELAMTTGQMYRFRMVNAGGDPSLDVYIVDESNVATSNCDIREIAMDGVYLDAPRIMHDSQSFLGPAMRVDWLVKCNAAGTYKIRSFSDEANDLSIGSFNRYTGDLVTLTVSGTAVDPVQSFPTTLPARPSFISDLQSVAESDIGGRFVVELDPKKYLNRERWSGPTNYRYKMTIGTIQEWYLLNTDTTSSHPLHIHVNHFQVISYNAYTGAYETGSGNDWTLSSLDDDAACFYGRPTTGGRKRRSAEEKRLSRTKRQASTLTYLGHDTRYVADAGNTLGYARIGDWRDVVLVPPLANITIRFNTDTHIGDVIIHCHILTHEDGGMMMITEIVNEGASTEANTPTGNIYPGTCQECDRYPFNNPTTLCETATTAATNMTTTTTTAARNTTTTAATNMTTTTTTAATNTTTTAATATTSSFAVKGEASQLMILLSISVLVANRLS